jgi:alanyl-tRNA synthetase
VAVSIPDDFYTMIAKEHLAASDRETSADKALEDKVRDLPPTRYLYYEDVLSREFKAKVLRIVDGKYVVLDQSAFYPEGGGQPSDQGKIISRQGETKVLAAQKVGKVILHETEGRLPKEGSVVTCLIDWPRRLILMRHHTSTHLVMGAARRVLGEHVWQTGAQKGLEKSRLDITHFEKISPEELRRIELLANEAVFENIPVEVTWLPRAEAEKKYGFRLYQGGVVPGREIRVVKVGDWDVEACGGTHCRYTGEVGFIKILGSDRIQDGVERLTFAAGMAALKFVQERDESIRRAAEALNTSTENFEEEVKKLHDEHRESRKELIRIGEELANCKANALLANARDIGGIKVVTETFRDLNLQQLISIGNTLVTKEPLLVIGLGTVVAGTAGLEIGRAHV